MHVLLVRFIKLNVKMCNYICIVEPLSYYNIVHIGTITITLFRYIIVFYGTDNIM